MRNKNCFKTIKENYVVNSPGCKGDYNSNHTANTRHLIRIIIYLIDINKKVTISNIRIATGISGDRLKDALLFLTSNKILLKMFERNQKVYNINSKWSKLKNENKKI